MRSPLLETFAARHGICLALLCDGEGTFPIPQPLPLIRIITLARNSRFIPWPEGPGGMIQISKNLVMPG
jgi:hypothetical protein